MAKIRGSDRPKAGIYTNYRKSKGKPVVYLALLLLVILLMVIVYNPNRKEEKSMPNRSTRETPASTVQDFVKQGELTFLKADSSLITTIDIEIADDDLRRERGLMYRRQMELGQGMLFIFEEEEQRSFWMKNTYLPLDIMYLNGEKRIVRIHENTPTQSEMSIPSDYPAKYVVEVNAGFTALYNIRVGDRMVFVRK